MNICDAVEKLLDSVIAYDDIWETEPGIIFRFCCLCIEDTVTATIKPEKKGCCKQNQCVL